MPQSEIKIFAGEASSVLGEKIAKEMNLKLGKKILHRFADGEIQPSFPETVRGAFVFIIQSTMPPAENILELLLMIDALKRASAYKVVAVVPYYGYARQDRKDKPRVPIAAKLMADMISTAGADRVVTMDLHADQIQGFFSVPLDHLFASSVFIDYLKNLNLDDMVIAAPDMGSSKRANKYANLLHVPLVVSYKGRSRPNEVDEMRIIGDVEGKNVIIVDDIVDTAGTLVKSAEMLMSMGAKSVRAAIVHPILSGNAVERINNSTLTELIVTDTIPLKKEAQNSKKIKVTSVAKHFADVLWRIYNNLSISKIFTQKS